MVNPFAHECVEKIVQLNQLRESKDLSFRLEVDGGVNIDTGKLCLDAGADTLVAGSAFYNAENPEDFARKLLG